MLRYENLGSAISVDVTSVCMPDMKKNDERRYIVECFYRYYKEDGNSGCYQIDSMWLLRNDVEMKIRIDYDPVSVLEDDRLVKADRDNIRTTARDIIVDLAKQGIFNHSVEQMDYIVDCFDVGDDVLWKEEQRRIAEENDLS